MTATHRVPAADFDELAAGRGGAGAVRRLAAGQLSSRLLRVRAVLDLIGDDPRPDAAAARAGWRTLSELGTGPAAEVLMHPPVGAWLARCLATLLSAAPTDRPPGLVGHLAGIAAAAGARAGRDLELRVPVRAGSVHLPTLGAVRVPAPDGWAVVSVSAGAVTVRAAGDTGPTGLAGPGWRPLRRLRVGAGSERLDVCLDDLDPYRDLPGLCPADRLDAAAVDRWRRVLGTAWWMLTRHHPGPAAALAAGLRSIVPLIDTRADQGVSATSVDCFGSVAMSRPAAADVLAVGLVHEFQHAKLGALLDLLPLYDPDRRLLLYAPWRDDPRPLGGLFQGAYAFLGVTSFWRAQREVRTGRAARFAEFEFARWREQTSRAVEVLAGSGALTPAGERFVGGMAAALADARTEPVPAVAAAAAGEADVDHWTTWRTRNLVPDDRQVRAATTAWRSGTPWPGPGPVGRPAAAGTFAPAPNARLTLLHARLREPDHFDNLRRDPAALAAALPHATAADLAWADGDFATATTRYAGELAVDPGSVHAWSGLVLAACRGNPGDLPPELLRAVSDELARAGGPRPDPVALVTWATA